MALGKIDDQIRLRLAASPIKSYLMALVAWVHRRPDKPAPGSFLSLDVLPEEMSLWSPLLLEPWHFVA